MKPFSKRKRIKNVLERFRSGFNRAVVLKFALFFLALGATFYFKVWAARQQKYRPSSPPVASVQKTAIEPFLASNDSGDAQHGLPPGSTDVNTASSEELESLPGIGSRLAEEIVQDRLRKGPFLQTNDLLRVKGIGPKKIRQIESYLRFKG